jgi:hypothetical protein
MPTFKTSLEFVQAKDPVSKFNFADLAAQRQP